MKNLIYIMFILATINMLGQASNRHQFSSVPDTSRYEIMQSEEGARYTFIIDKYYGTVFQMVKTANDDVTWQMINRAEVSALDIPAYDEAKKKVNYQLMLSGLGAKYTFLLEVNTGKTWQLSKDKESGQVFWHLIDW